MRFVKDWDKILIKQMKMCPEKSILTVYPRPYKKEEEFKSPEVLEGPLVMCFKEFS